jgi:putative ABC transport system ATP-binding protein
VTMATLTISELTVEYVSAGYRIRPIDALSFDASTGQLVVLLGPSGCGKTTLLSCIAGLLTPASGEIEFDGIDVVGLRGPRRADYRRDTVGVIFQAFNLIPSLSAHANVMVPLRLAGVSHAKSRARADELLELVGLTNRRKNRPGQMSGGQQQRVAIARALAHDPPLVVQVEGVLGIIRDLAAAGRLVIVATHDDRITQLADKVIELVPRRPDVTSGPRSITLRSGELLFRQGDLSDLVYVVRSGAVDVFRERADGSEESIVRRGPGEYFGELGPLLNLPRSASARAASDTTLIGYPAMDFRRRGHDRPRPRPRPHSSSVR